jgi:hypothetical protein
MSKSCQLPNCFNCARGLFVPGRSGTREDPPEPDEVNCKEMDIDDWQADYYKDATRCQKYVPKFVQECANCKQPIGIPETIHKYWADLEDTVPVCCENCKNELEQKFDDYINEMYKGYAVFGRSRH